MGWVCMCTAAAAAAVDQINRYRPVGPHRNVSVLFFTPRLFTGGPTL